MKDETICPHCDWMGESVDLLGVEHTICPHCGKNVDDEADEMTDDIMDENANADWVNAVQGGYTILGLNEYTEQMKNRKSRADVIACDEREEQEEVDGITYYIYRRY